MASINGASFLTKFADLATGLFKPGQTRTITSAEMRVLIQDLKDSYANINDGAFGLMTAQSIGAVSLNTITNAGFYYISGDETDRPGSTVLGFLLVQKFNSNLVLQTIWREGSTEVYQRGKYGSSWDAWALVGNQILDEDNFASDSPTKAPSQQSVKAYVDAVAAGIVTSWKAPVKVATTGNITLSGTQTIDGISVGVGDRVLVKDQSTGSQNGIYVAASGAWARAADANTGSELEGAATTVQQGTSNGNTTWLQTADGITLDTTALVWQQIGSSVPDASETEKGRAELATQAETDAAADDARIVTPLKRAVAEQKGGTTWAVASGTNTYTASLTPAPAAYTTGMRVTIQFTNGSTSTTPTLNLNGLGAKTIVKRNNTALVSGDIAAGQIYTLVYDGTNFRLMGVANTAVFNDVLLTLQAAASGKRNFVSIDDTGKISKHTWVEVDETNKKITQTGSNSLTTQALHEWLDSNGDLIMRLFNGRTVEIGGTTSAIIVGDSIPSNSAWLELNSNQVVAFKEIDKVGNLYSEIRTTTGDLAKRLLQKVEYDQLNGDAPTTLQQFDGTSTTTAAASNTIATIPMATNEEILNIRAQFTVSAPDGECGGVDINATVRRDSAGTVALAGSQDKGAGERRTAGDWTCSIQSDDTNKRVNLNFINNSGTGKAFKVVIVVWFTRTLEPSA